MCLALDKHTFLTFPWLWGNSVQLHKRWLPGADAHQGWRKRLIRPGSCLDLCHLARGRLQANKPAFIFFFFLILLLFFYFTMLYLFCHTSTWIRHRCTHVPNREPPSLLPPHTIPLGHPSAPAPSILYPASNLDWRFISYMILYMFQCHSPKSSYPLPLPQSPKDCSIYLCLFCCLAYRVIVTIFLNSIYMR